MNIKLVNTVLPFLLFVSFYCTSTAVNSTPLSSKQSFYLQSKKPILTGNATVVEKYSDATGHYLIVRIMDSTCSCTFSRTLKVSSLLYEAIPLNTTHPTDGRRLLYLKIEEDGNAVYVDLEDNIAALNMLNQLLQLRSK